MKEMDVLFEDSKSIRTYYYILQTKTNQGFTIFFASKTILSSKRENPRGLYNNLSFQSVTA